MIEEVYERLLKKRDELHYALLNGLGVEDYPKYRHLVGKIQGMEIAIRILEECLNIKDEHARSRD